MNDRFERIVATALAVVMIVMGAAIALGMMAGAVWLARMALGGL